ncbi:bifunctional DNA primase/polymerase [Nocardioides sambongensis]|uniref:bifunctional DNA primase/polymerase n=1 Tax=Nocardioides sambongensis TaxID=2589074 RepID=UPI001E44132E|nr:bifunctional DNA primase/polymerase [Nocardioides sambongensis]
MAESESTADLASATRRYVHLGIPVFPCVPRGKRPLTKNGFHNATTSARTVTEWWHRTPEANIGIPTGWRSGLDVVDVDVHGSGSGYPAFEGARAAGIADGWAWLVRTPSGGLHAYYPRTAVTDAADRGEQRSWQAPSAHVDFRGDGGYVVVPPSRLSIDGAQATYAVIATATHEPRPLDAQRLRDLLEPPRPAPPPAPTRALGSPEGLANYVASRPEGERNRGLFWAACRMVEEGHRIDTTRSILGDAARSAGLPERETESTIRSAYRIAQPGSTSRTVTPQSAAVTM